MDFLESRFFEVLRSMVLGAAVMVLYPLMIYYVIQVIHPRPALIYDAQVTEQERAKKEVVYQEQMKPYEKIFFIVSSIAGLFALVLGACIPIPFLGFGFIMSGVSTLTMGYTNYWGNLHDIFKLFSLLGAILLILGISFLMMRRSRAH